MNKMNFKKLLPHILAVVIFLIISIVYCKPAFDGKVVSQHDTQGWRGMSQQSMEYHEKYGTYPLWTNSMFSGMPAYQIAFDAKTRIHVGTIEKVFFLGLPQPVYFFFMACICFYFLCIVAGANSWISIMGGIAYAYSTFDPIIIGVGHNTQMMSIAYAPSVIAGLLLLFQKRYWSGFAVTALFSTLLIFQNHIQIVYYTLLIAAIFVIGNLYRDYKRKDLQSGIKAAVLGTVAALLGLACNAVNMMPTFEYSKESMRGGKSELTLGKDSNNKTKGGLDKDYAFRYSFGIPETFTLLIPGIYGGSNGGKEYSSSSNFVKKLTEAGVPDENAVQMANGYSYWGNQPVTSGPVYLGIIICFLFLFGMVYLKNWYKWWLLAASLVGLVLAWGANLKGINYFLFDHLPFYNKFRAPTMALVIPQFCFPFLAVLSISQLLRETDWQYAWKKLRTSVIAMGAIVLLLTGFYLTASFTGNGDKALKDQFKQDMLRQVPAGQQVSPPMVQQADDTSKQWISALHADRKDLMGGDLLRNILLLTMAILLIGLFVRKKIRPWILITGLIILSSFDLFGIDQRYLSSSNFIEETDFEGAFTPTEADLQIMKDPDHANFRVFNQTVDVFNDASTSFHHNSVGGYHPAKLGLYQDIIENQLSKGNMQVFNMLNTKYFITQNPGTGKPMAQQNPAVFGNCWLVKGIKLVENANEEMKALDSTDLRDTVIIEKRFSNIIKQAPVYDSSASIKLVENLNDIIRYSFRSAQPQFAVFSEVYYKSGWNVFIDDQKADYAKVNYILRGMYIPAGKHAIEFRFEPASFTIGRLITIWANILVIIAIIAAIVVNIKRKRTVIAQKDPVV